MDIVLDNIIFSRQRVGGISVYWNEVISRLKKNEDFCCTELGNDGGAINFSPDYNMSNKHLFHSSYFRTSKNKNAINILTIHDCIHMKKITLRNVFFYFFLKSKIKKSDVIICVSNTTKEEVISYYNVESNKKIAVIHNGVSDTYQFLNLKRENSVLYVGDRSWYKNFDLAIKVAGILRYKLIIVGKPINQKEKKLLVKYNVDYEILQNIKDEKLLNLYNSVKYFVYGSEFEGFGIPLLEAARCKCPIITLDRPFVKEVLGENTICVDNDDIELEKKLKSLKAKTTLKLTESALKFTEKYSWDITFQKLIKVYKNLL